MVTNFKIHCTVRGCAFAAGWIGLIVGVVGLISLSICVAVARSQNWESEENASKNQQRND